MGSAHRARVVDLSTARDRAGRRPAGYPPGRPPAPPPLRLTRRGRVVVVSIVVAIVVAVAIMIMPGVSIAGPDAAEAPRRHLVVPGETLWAVAVALDESADTRVVVDRLMRLNHLRSPLITPGQSLLLP
ncbi:LysM peptidoglycan-binding domain-containing protein [Frankia sp. CcWB3]